MTSRAAAEARSRSVMEGYALVAVSFLIWGAIGALVRYSTMPESALNVCRMTIGVLLVGAIFARRSMLAEVRRRDVWPRLLLMGAFSASTILLFFVALRLTDVAIGMFLLFTNPVYVALLAPRLMRQPADRIVVPALVIALAGMLVILLPGLLGAADVSSWGIACGVATGITYAAYALVTKDLTRRVRSTTIGLAEMAIDAVLLLPLAAWQVGGGYDVTRNDLVAVAVLGVVCTAIPYVLYPAGLRRIRVEHASILGYLEPVSAPFYAYLLLGEAPSVLTVVGGALIVAAGVLVIAFGRREAVPEPAPGGAGA
jgi:drug/metabolite transporter (DMT)-like permease